MSFPSWQCTSTSADGSLLPSLPHWSARRVLPISNCISNCITMQNFVIIGVGSDPWCMVSGFRVHLFSIMVSNVLWVQQYLCLLRGGAHPCLSVHWAILQSNLEMDCHMHTPPLKKKKPRESAISHILSPTPKLLHCPPALLSPPPVASPLLQSPLSAPPPPSRLSAPHSQALVPVSLPLHKSLGTWLLFLLLLFLPTSAGPYQFLAHQNHLCD